jgi:hypothetical protein
MSNIYMIRRKTDGKYICGSGRYPWFSDDIGRTFYSLHSVKIFLTNYLKCNKIKTWENGRYKFNAGEFFTPSNILLNCEVVAVEVKPSSIQDIFEFSAQTEMERKTKKKKAKK